jgi:cytochrome c
MKKWLLVASIVLLVSGWCALCSAAVNNAETALAKESEAYCTATSAVPPTVKTIVNKVNQAVDLLNKEGVQAFPKFKGKNSNFIFNGTYIWVHSNDGTMLMHPIKPALVGKNVLGIKDSDGKSFFKAMNDTVNQNGSGWVQYKWPKPGQKDSSVKISYVKSATVNGKPVVVGCGVYDWTLKDVETALKKTASAD